MQVQVQGAPRARQRDIREARALRARPFAQQHLDEGIDGVFLATLLGLVANTDGRHQQMIAALLARQLQPVQQPRIVAAAVQANADDEHMVELESLRAVNGHERNRAGLRRVLGEQPGHDAFEIERPSAQAFAIFFVEREQEATRGGEFGVLRTGARVRRARTRCARPCAHGVPVRAGARPTAATPWCAPGVPCRPVTNPGWSPLSTAGTVESRAASAITVRSTRDNPTNGARSTASQATRSSGDSRARASASRSRTTGTSASGSRFTPMNGTPRAPSAARIARRWPRAPASTATLSSGRLADQFGDQIAPPLRPLRAAAQSA